MDTGLACLEFRLKYNRDPQNLAELVPEFLSAEPRGIFSDEPLHMLRDTGGGEFREIVRPERITWTFEFEGMPGHVSVDTVTFEERDGKTTIRATSVFDTVEDRDGMLQSGMEEGAAETYERLDEYLEELARTAA